MSATSQPQYSFPLELQQRPPLVTGTFRTVLQIAYYLFILVFIETLAVAAVLALADNEQIFTHLGRCAWVLLFAGLQALGLRLVLRGS